MYIYYEEFDGIVSVVLSSNGVNNNIDWKNPKEKAIANLCVSLFKQVQIKDYNYDDKTKVWAFFGYVGKVIYTQLESMITQGLFPNSKVVKIEDLEEKALRGTLNSVKKTTKEKFAVEDFFYSPAASSTELSGKALHEKLASLLNITSVELATAKDVDLKKIYRRAALKYHPDRNNGDGSKMSELNMIWGIYMNQGG